MPFAEQNLFGKFIVKPFSEFFSFGLLFSFLFDFECLSWEWISMATFCVKYFCFTIFRQFSSIYSSLKVFEQFVLKEQQFAFKVSHENFPFPRKLFFFKSTEICVPVIFFYVGLLTFVGIASPTESYWSAQELKQYQEWNRAEPRLPAVGSLAWNSLWWSKIAQWLF